MREKEIKKERLKERRRQVKVEKLKKKTLADDIVRPILEETR